MNRKWILLIAGIVGIFLLSSTFVNFPEKQIKDSSTDNYTGKQSEMPCNLSNLTEEIQQLKSDQDRHSTTHKTNRLEENGKRQKKDTGIQQINGIIINPSLTPLPPTPTPIPVSQDNPVIISVEPSQENVNIWIEPNGNEIVGIQFDIEGCQIKKAKFSNSANINFSFVQGKTIIGIAPATKIFPQKKFLLVSVETTNVSQIKLSKVIVINDNYEVIYTKTEII